MNYIEYAIKSVGGGVSAAQICLVSNTAVSKWKQRGCLPRTEYTGETNYAQKLAKASNGAFTAEWLLDNANPERAIA